MIDLHHFTVLSNGLEKYDQNRIVTYKIHCKYHLMPSTDPNCLRTLTTDQHSPGR